MAMMTDETYWLLQGQDQDEGMGTVLRVRNSELEDLTGFIELKETGSTSLGRHYEADLNVDGKGEPIYIKGKHEADVIGLTIAGGKVEVHKGPKTPVRITLVPMRVAGEIIERVRYLRDVDAYIG